MGCYLKLLLLTYLHTASTTSVLNKALNRRRRGLVWRRRGLVWRRRGLVGKTVALAAECWRFESSVW